MTRFSAGPRLSEPPQGDVARQAVASLRGYAYQLYASAIAWINLGCQEELYLEVAEDYAVVATDALKGVQVKDTAASGPVTINAKAVRNAIDGFVTLVENNRDRSVWLRFLSTAPIGIEQSATDRVGALGALAYWTQAARFADVAPLRKVLMGCQLSRASHDFVESRDDDQLRSDLLQRIQWDCGAPGLDATRSKLEGAVRAYAMAEGVNADETRRAGNC